jgi:hypothetical protein
MCGTGEKWIKKKEKIIMPERQSKNLLCKNENDSENSQDSLTSMYCE